MKCIGLINLAVATVLYFPTTGIAAELVGRVVGVHDGDTITVLDESKIQHRIRLSGIDAPENSQAFGAESRENLDILVAGKVASVEWHKRDRYSRMVGKVRVGGRDVCLEQIAAGMAWHYKQYEREQTAANREEYTKAENRARSNGVGLWSHAEPMPPWEYRRKNIPTVP